MSKSFASFKDLGPLLIILVIMLIAYMTIRSRLNWNRDRINELVGQHARLQNQVDTLEQSLAGSRGVPPPLPPPRPPPPKVGDVSFRAAGIDDPAIDAPIVQWIKALTPAYTALKAKHKPPSGRAIVARVIFDGQGVVNVFDYIKAPLNKKLSSDLETAIRTSKLVVEAPKLKSKLPNLSIQISFEP